MSEERVHCHLAVLMLYYVVRRAIKYIVHIELKTRICFWDKMYNIRNTKNDKIKKEQDKEKHNKAKNKTITKVCDSSEVTNINYNL